MSSLLLTPGHLPAPEHPNPSAHEHLLDLGYGSIYYEEEFSPYMAGDVVFWSPPFHLYCLMGQPRLWINEDGRVQQGEVYNG